MIPEPSLIAPDFHESLEEAVICECGADHDRWDVLQGICPHCQMPINEEEKP